MCFNIFFTYCTGPLWAVNHVIGHLSTGLLKNTAPSPRQHQLLLNPSPNTHTLRHQSPSSSSHCNSWDLYVSQKPGWGCHCRARWLTPGPVRQTSVSINLFSLQIFKDLLLTENEKHKETLHLKLPFYRHLLALQCFLLTASCSCHPTSDRLCHSDDRTKTVLSFDSQ